MLWLTKGRSKKNKEMLETLFLDGGNASYLEKMQARFFTNPQSVDPSWQHYFSSLGEDSKNAKLNADGPSWKSVNWPKGYKRRNDFSLNFRLG
jgi:2-oxoglutarate dehydrogenase E1 component